MDGLWIPILLAAALVATSAAVGLARAASGSDRVERWGVFELALKGPAGGNPFVDVELGARFEHGALSDESKGASGPGEPEGFYDGDGVYRIRFMPDETGVWTYTTKSNCPELDGRTGRFTCVEPSPDRCVRDGSTDAPGNHGPVRVRDTYHFACADGTPFYPVGTTIYGWAQEPDRNEKETLAALRDAPFNKVRMSVTPHAPTTGVTKREARTQPYVDWRGERRRFNPEHFRHLERRVADLRDLGIEADLILFHSNAAHGYSTMTPERDARLVRHVVARLAAYRNVWWSLANEFDFVKEKKVADWERIAEILVGCDPYGRLRSIHNCKPDYDWSRSWVTHVSCQRPATPKLMRDMREKYGKPLVNDESKYEGSKDYRAEWGQLSGEEMTRNFWWLTISGGYATHGETLEQEFFRGGGELHGEGPERIAFLKRILETSPDRGFEPVAGDDLAAHKGEEYYLYYFGPRKPARHVFSVPSRHKYRVDILDTWEMTTTPLKGTFSGRFEIRLPGRPYIAVRIRRAAE